MSWKLCIQIVVFYVLRLTVAAPGEECGTLVEIDYERLVDPTAAKVQHAVATAFGRGGLGILAVRGVPAELTAARRKLLHMSRLLALLPEETLAAYERPEHKFVVGWSRGREKFRGDPDTAKGSFYANALYADPAQGDAELRKRYPDSTAEPLWPDEHVGANVSSTFRELSKMMYDISFHVLRLADAVVEAELRRRPLRRIFGRLRRGKRLPLHVATHERSRLHVARLLHYYPSRTPTWCGWHNDNSVVTALAPAMFFDDDTGRELANAPKGAGLVVYAEPNRTILVDVPDAEDVLLFQIGEAAQVLSGGALVATPHAVLPGEAAERNVSRDSFAVFVEPHWTEPLRPPPGRSLSDIYARGHADDVIPPLRDRLPQVPVQFAQFLADSVARYHRA